MKTLEDLPVVDVNDGVECLVKNDPNFDDVRRIVFAKTKDGRFFGSAKHTTDVFNNPWVYCYKYAEPIQPKILPLSSVNDIPAWCFDQPVYGSSADGMVYAGVLHGVCDWGLTATIKIEPHNNQLPGTRCGYSLGYAADQKFEVHRDNRIFKLYREISK